MLEICGHDPPTILVPAWATRTFSDNGNGTVTDNLTGLIWLKRTNCFAVRACEQALSDANSLMPTMSNYLFLSPRRMLVDGLLLGAVFTIVAVGSLWLDARLWLEDYPPDIQAAAGSVGEAPLALRIVTAAVLFGALLSGMVYSNWLIAKEHGWAPRFRSVFVHTIVLFWIVNLVDVLVVDWLVFVTIQPDWVVLPGTAGLASYDDYWFHLDASVLSLQPWLGSIVLALLAGLLLPRFWRRRAELDYLDATLEQ